MKKLLTILGPTASGKSAMAMYLAKELDAEIVSCDSMQVYRNLDIGSAKPSKEDLLRVPHHLIDILDIQQRFSVADFITLAQQAIQEIQARGKQVIMCGGTGLYARSLLYGFEFWPSNQEISDSIRFEMQNGNEQRLYEEFCQLATKELQVSLVNPRHWTRALEVMRITGEAPQAQQHHNVPKFAAPEHILLPTPEFSRERIRKRCMEMIDEGWIEETEQLISKGLLESPTACQAIGYKEIIQFVKGEIHSKEDLIEKLVTQTSRYAKRQRTWMRNQHPNSIQHSIESLSDWESASKSILKTWKTV
ncbi:MAG: tRNA (adenosine(37)-N6)-dimethylallyltransferase MiaA [Lentisphaeria bacterium]|nr:tRNA (adenosine(37)-N6)-dimethylallyltransferase MiaA [Lentisphaeria bacterium]